MVSAGQNMVANLKQITQSPYRKTCTVASAGLCGVGSQISTSINLGLAVVRVRQCIGYRSLQNIYQSMAVVGQGSAEFTNYYNVST